MDGFADPVLELARRCGDGPEGVLEFAGTTDEEARRYLGMLDEVEAEVRAAELAGQLRRAGLLW